MLLNVKGRDIAINDELATRYEKVGTGPVSEEFALCELSTTYRCNIDNIFDSLSDEEIIKGIEDAMRDYIDLAGV